MADRPKLLRLSSSSGILDRLAGALLSGVPDCERLADDVATALSLSKESAYRIVRRVVAGVNSKLFPPITHLELVHTDGCNLACSYCFEKDMRGARRMPLLVTRKAIDLLIEYSGDADKLWITHFGGEPLLNFANIRFATEYARDKASALGKSVVFDITTNGTLLTEERVDYLADHHVKILVSVDGLQSTHDRYRVDRQGRGTFERVMRSLALLKRRQMWIGVKMTVMPTNVAHMFDDVTGLHRRGVNQFVIGHATGISWSTTDIKSYRRELERLYRWYNESKGPELRIAEFDEPEERIGFFGCQAGRNSIAVSTTGEISSCSKVLALNNKKLVAKLGDVEFGITQIKNRNELLDSSPLERACEACGIASEYQGGCYASNYAAHGSLFTPNVQDHEFSVLKRLVCWS
jgi:uncharacterized protein